MLEVGRKLGTKGCVGNTYIRVGAEDLNHFLVKRGSKTLEDVLVDVVGLARELLHGSIKRSKSAALLELDNVLVGNHLAAGLNKRSGLGALLNSVDGGSAESEGKKTQKNGKTHFDRR